jgi:hypothetical protein
MLKLTGMWQNKSKSGITYYAGKVGNTRFLLFKNDKGDNEKAPDLQLSIVKADETEDWTYIPETDDKRIEGAIRKAVENKQGASFGDLEDEIQF